MSKHDELPIIQRMYDLIVWYVPRLNKLPRNYKYALDDRIQAQLYDVLEGLVRARYASDKLALLEALHVELNVLRAYTRLCVDLECLNVRQYEYVAK